MLIIWLYFYKYSPEILEIEKKEAINFLRKFLAKYTTVFILRIISILMMLIGFWGIASFIMKQWYMAAFFRQVKIGVLTLTLEKKQ